MPPQNRPKCSEAKGFGLIAKVHSATAGSAPVGKTQQDSRRSRRRMQECFIGYARCADPPISFVSIGNHEKGTLKQCVDDDDGGDGVARRG
jgi:hypothetical protein